MHKQETLIHYSDRPLAFSCIYSQTQEPREGCIHGKPRGLWVSVEGEDDWKSWCEAENFRNIAESFATVIELREDARILRLTSALEIDSFTEEFYDRDYMKQIPGFDWRGHAIRWADVAAQFQGIIIAPYCWQRRMAKHTFWYYGWDCASGCIWDAAAIASATACITVGDTAVIRTP